MVNNKLLAFLRSLLFNFDYELQGIKNVLVLGCGPQMSIPALSRIKSYGLDIVFQDLIISRKNKIYNYYICGNVTNLCFKSKSFDLIAATHLLEHLKKEDGLAILGRLEEIARRKILIGVPNPDPHGLFGSYEWHGSMHAGHQSQWCKEDFLKRGYRVRGVDGLRFLPHKLAINVDYRKKKWVRRILQLCEIITAHYPELANNLICIKNLN